jgi:hypothetical protein
MRRRSGKTPFFPHAAARIPALQSDFSVYHERGKQGKMLFLLLFLKYGTLRVEFRV